MKTFFCKYILNQLNIRFQHSKIQYSFVLQLQHCRLFRFLHNEAEQAWFVITIELSTMKEPYVLVVRPKRPCFTVSKCGGNESCSISIFSNILNSIIIKWKHWKKIFFYHEIYLSSGSLLEMKTMLHISKKWIVNINLI